MTGPGTSRLPSPLTPHPPPSLLPSPTAASSMAYKATPPSIVSDVVRPSRPHQANSLLRLPSSTIIGDRGGREDVVMTAHRCFAGQVHFEVRRLRAMNFIGELPPARRRQSGPNCFPRQPRRALLLPRVPEAGISRPAGCTDFEYDPTRGRLWDSLRTTGSGK